jgi:hypothetical protein
MATATMGNTQMRDKMRMVFVMVSEIVPVSFHSFAAAG